MKQTITQIFLAMTFATIATESCFARKHDNHSPRQFAARMEQRCGTDLRNCYRFSAADREALRSHSEFNWTTPLPNGEHPVRFYQGEPLTFSELRRFRAVPAAYARDVAPPPSTYRLGYYNGMIYAYNPTTGVVADAVDVKF